MHFFDPAGRLFEKTSETEFRKRIIPVERDGAIEVRIAALRCSICCSGVLGGGWLRVAVIPQSLPRLAVVTRRFWHWF